MPSKGSVTSLLAPVQAGDPAVVQQLWERYFERLVGLARKKHLRAAPAGGDEQDVALSALASFCRNAERAEVVGGRVAVHLPERPEVIVEVVGLGSWRPVRP